MQTFYTVDGAASMLKLSASTVRNWIWLGRISVIRIGGRVLLAEEEIQRLIEAGRCPALSLGVRHRREQKAKKMHEGATFSARRS